MPALPSANLPGLQPVQPSLFLPSVAPVPAQVPAPVRLVPAPAAPASPESSEDEGAEVDAAEQGEDLPEAKEETHRERRAGTGRGRKEASCHTRRQ